MPTRARSIAAWTSARASRRRQEQAALRHRLIDVVDPDERYHAARFRTEALAAIAEIGARGALPVVVGGTGLYVRALLKGLHAAPPADLALRRELDDVCGGPGTPRSSRPARRPRPGRGAGASSQ